MAEIGIQTDVIGAALTATIYNAKGIGLCIIGLTEQCPGYYSGTTDAEDGDYTVSYYQLACKIAHQWISIINNRAFIPLPHIPRSKPGATMLNIGRESGNSGGINLESPIYTLNVRWDAITTAQMTILSDLIDAKPCVQQPYVLPSYYDADYEFIPLSIDKRSIDPEYWQVTMEGYGQRL